MNEYDSLIDQYIKSTPPKIDPVDSSINEVKDIQETQFKINEKQVSKEHPDDYAKYVKVAEEQNIPVAMVQRNWDRFKPKEYEIDYEDLSNNSPKTRDFLNDPTNLSLFKDEINSLKESEYISKQIPSKDKGFINDTILAGQQGFVSLGSSTLVLALAHGIGDEEFVSKALADSVKTQRSLDLITPTHVQNFQELMSKERQDLNLAKDKFLVGYDELKDGRILDGLEKAAKGGFETVYEALDFAKEFISNPRSASYTIAQNIPNAIPSIGGSIAGVPLGPIGIYAGSFTGGVSTEVGSSILEDLEKQGVDTSNQDAIKKAFRDPKIIDEIKTRAYKKGITTSAIDSLFTVFAGKLLKGAAGKSLKAKAIAGLKELGVQSTGESLSEFGGQLAREGSLSKVDLGESLQEGLTSLGQSVADTSVGAVRRKATSLRDLSNETKTFINSFKDSQGIQAIKDLSNKIRDSKSFNRSPKKIEQLVGNLTQGESIYFQASDWEKLFKEGISPLEKADELLPEGRKQYLEAKESGNPIEVKQSHYITKIAQSEIQDSLEGSIKLTPNGLSKNEIQEFTNNFENTIQQLAKPAQEELITKKQINDSFEAVKEDVALQLMEAGHSKQTAQIYAEAMTPLRVLAERANIDPYALYEKYNIRIQKQKSGDASNFDSTQKNNEKFYYDEELKNMLDEVRKDPKSNLVKELGFKNKTSFVKAATDPKHKDHKIIKNAINQRLQNIEHFQKDKNTPQGSLKISPKREMTISLFENADKSTFLHETGHLFLEILGDLASVEDAPQEIKDQFNEILKYLGVNSREEIKTAQHEKFARTVEAYLASGEAPSKGLKQVFRQFRVWLASVYARLLKNNIKLTPQVRDMMNKLYASQAEIKEALDDSFINKADVLDMVEVLNLNEKQKNDLVEAHTEATFLAEEELISKEMAKLQTKQETQFKAVEKEVRKEVTQEVVSNPFYTAVDIVKDLKFNKEAIKELIGEKVLRQIPEEYLSEKEGLTPDLISDMASIPNIPEFINTLLNSPNKEMFIDQETNRRMDELYPELSDASLAQDQAVEAIHTEKLSELKRLELEILWEKFPTETKNLFIQIGRKLPAKEEIKNKAAKEINDKKLEKVSPYIYSRLEIKNRRASITALTKGDFKEAYEAKYNEYYNHELFNAAKEVNQLIEKFETKTKKIFNQPKEKLSKKYEMDYLNLAKGILDSFHILKLTEKKAQQLEEYFSIMQRVNPDGYAKIEAMKEILQDIVVSDKKELTVDEYKNISEMVNSLIDLAKEEKEVFSINKKESIDVVMSNINNNLKLIPKSEFSQNEFIKKWQTRILNLNAASTRVEHLIGNLDRHDFINGPLRNFLFQPLRDAQTKYAQDFQVQQEKINQILKDHFKGIFKNKRQIALANYFPEGKGSLNQHEIVMALLHSGNESNLQKLLLGRGWGTLDANGKLDTSYYMKFLNEMAKEGMITKEITEGVQKIWDLMDTFKDRIQIVNKKLSGNYMKEIESVPLEINELGITLRGGYIPAITDPSLVEAASSRENQITMDMEKARYAYASVNKGFTKDRMEGYNKALLLDFRLIIGHVEHAVKYYNLVEVVNNANKIIKNKEFRELIHDINPDMASTTFDAWLGRFAMQRTEKVEDTSNGRDLAEFGRLLRRNTVAQIMVGNVRNAIENFTDLPAYLAKVNGKELLNSLGMYIAHSKEISNQVILKSEYMKTRMQDGVRASHDAYKDITLTANGALASYKKFINFTDKHGFFLQKMTMNILETVGWLGAYNEKIALGWDDDKAVEWADHVVSTIGGGATALDVSTSEAGNMWQKLIMTFAGYFINKGNLVRYSDKKLKTYTYAMAIPAILSSALYKAFKGKLDDDEDDEYIDDLADTFVMSQVRFLAATQPYGGAAFRFLEGQVTESTFDNKLSISPVVQKIESVQGVAKLITSDDLKGKDVKDTMSFIGLISGIPVGSPLVANPVMFMIDVNEGNQSPREPGDYIRGFTTGKSE